MWNLSAAEHPKSKLGFSQTAADVNQVPTASARTKQGASGSYFACHSYVNENVFLPRRIPACQGASKLARSAAQAAEK
jgi:hypothetical protein